MPAALLSACPAFSSFSTALRWHFTAPPGRGAFTFSVTGALPALSPADRMVSVWHPALVPDTGEPTQPSSGPAGARGSWRRVVCAPPHPTFPWGAAGGLWPRRGKYPPPGLRLPRGPPAGTLCLLLPVRTDGGRAEQMSLLLAPCRGPRPHVPASSTAPSVPASLVPAAELPGGCLLRFRFRRASPASGASLLLFGLKAKLPVNREPGGRGVRAVPGWLF